MDNRYGTEKQEIGAWEKVSISSLILKMRRTRDLGRQKHERSRLLNELLCARLYTELDLDPKPQVTLLYF